MSKIFNKFVSKAKNLKKGFTLIELLVVIAIIGILASIVLVSLTSARGKARDATRVSSLSEMAKAVSIADTGTASAFVPNTAACATTAHVSVVGCTGTALAAGAFAWTSYVDPSTPGTMCKTAGDTGTTCQYSVATKAGAAGPTTGDYEICSKLENGSGSLAAGPIQVNSDSGGSVIAGCN